MVFNTNFQVIFVVFLMYKSCKLFDTYASDAQTWLKSGFNANEYNMQST